MTEDTKAPGWRRRKESAGMAQGNESAGMAQTTTKQSAGIAHISPKTSMSTLNSTFKTPN